MFILEIPRQFQYIAYYLLKEIKKVSFTSIVFIVQKILIYIFEISHLFVEYSPPDISTPC